MSLSDWFDGIECSDGDTNHISDQKIARTSVFDSQACECGNLISEA